MEGNDIVRSSIVTAFTIAVALIWKDVIEKAMDRLFPRGDALSAHILVAVIATALVVVAIKVFIRTEQKAEEALEGLGHLLNGTKKDARSGTEDSEGGGKG